ncbi:MAG TPA: 50S ribosomal protein L4 [Nitrospirales bacterium]|nr:50S ribosomal protein L4 [Nitrospiraceae bacterium]HNP28850.1 50S ribosomal protein L4 [Nitrospirales bacterium]
MQSIDAFPVFGPDSRPVDKIDLTDGVFSSNVNPSLVHRAVVMQRSSVRQGTASTLGRGEVRGGGKKPWKQKHTGRARSGSSRSPIWRGGGTVFGPKPRSYSSALPKKMYRAALRGALAAKTGDGLVVLDDLVLPELKTRQLVKSLSTVGATGKVLLVIEESLGDLIRIGKNVKNLKVLHGKDLNVYDVLWCDKLVVTKVELERIQEIWV